ncbi:MAG: hypothetical protein QM705_00950 [Ancrocorticia sp.]
MGVEGLDDDGLGVACLAGAGCVFAAGAGLGDDFVDDPDTGFGLPVLVEGFGVAAFVLVVLEEVVFFGPGFGAGFGLATVSEGFAASGAFGVVSAGFKRSLATAPASSTRASFSPTDYLPYWWTTRWIVASRYPETIARHAEIQPNRPSLYDLVKRQLLGD